MKRTIEVVKKPMKQRVKDRANALRAKANAPKTVEKRIDIREMRATGAQSRENENTDYRKSRYIFEVSVMGKCVDMVADPRAVIRSRNYPTTVTRIDQRTGLRQQVQA